MTRHHRRVCSFTAPRESFYTLRDPTEKIERSLFKIALWSGGILVLIIVLSIVGHRYYRGWQQRRLITQASEFFDKGDYKRASLNARRVIQLDPNNVQAARTMAKLAEKGGLRSAVDWRRRVLDLVGPNAEDALALARAGLRFDEIGSAELGLGKVPDQAKNTAEYHEAAADLAFAQRDALAAERHLSEAVRLAPENKRHALRLATLRLGARDPGVHEQARTTLAELQKETEIRREATRQLMDDAVRNRDFPRALGFAQQLKALPDATFRDQVAVLDTFRLAADPGTGQMLAQLQSDALQKPESVGDLLSWMNAHEMSADAIAWSRSFTAEMLGKKPVALALSDAYANSRDWDGLQRLVKNGAWGELDFLRSALYARALRQTGNELESQSQWNAAVKKASAKSEAVGILADLAQNWGWQDEAIDLLWLAAKDPVKGEAALQTLYTYFAKKGDTQNIYRVLLHLEELRPEDRNVQNNVAQLSLLLNLNADRGQKLAQDLFQKEPGNPAYASTYSFALLSRGEARKAVNVLSALPSDKLRQPAVAAYYGIALAAAGDHAKAAQFLDLGDLAKLLPEEKALVDKARRSLPQP